MRVFLNCVSGKKKEQQREDNIVERSEEAGRIGANGLGICW